MINLGEGAKIKHTQWYGPERYASPISDQEGEKKEPSVQGLKQSMIEALFLSSEPAPLTPDDARQCVNDFAGRHAALCEALLEFVGACSFEAISDDDELLQRVSQMMLNMSKRIERSKEEDRALYCFMSGSIKFIGLIGLTVYMIEVKVHEKRDSHETFRQRQQFIMQWREAYLDICRQWPDHLQRVLAQSEPDARND